MSLLTLLFLILIFLLGTAVGSFINVLLSRSLAGESWVRGRSKCDFCQKQIAWYDNLPLVSFLFLRGQTRCCHKHIPRSYPLVELLTGLLFLWWYAIGFVFFKLTLAPFVVLQPLFWLLVGILLVVVLVMDLKYMLIPDWAVIWLFAMTLFYRLFLTYRGIMQISDLKMALVGMIVSVLFLGSLWALTKGKGMGFGDVKLIAPLALLLGWPQILVGLFLAFILGGVFASGLLLFKKKKFGQVIPFGPFLILGTLLSLIWGDPLLGWYLGWL